MDESRGGCPDVAADALPWITETDMVEVDRVMIEDLHIELIRMMENAGPNLARLVLELFAPRSAAVAAGSGGNGGGGLVAARHLANAGVDVVVTTAQPVEAMGAIPAHQLDILERMGVPFSAEIGTADVVIDAVIGYSLRGAPRGVSADLSGQMSDSRAIVSLDTPSGLDVTTGTVPGVAVAADVTMTLALPKQGMRASRVVGDLYLADISVPPTVTSAFGRPPDFSPSPTLRVTPDPVGVENSVVAGQGALGVWCGAVRRLDRDLRRFTVLEHLCNEPVGIVRDPIPAEHLSEVVDMHHDRPATVQIDRDANSHQGPPSS